MAWRGSREPNRVWPALLGALIVALLAGASPVLAGEVDPNGPQAVPRGVGYTVNTQTGQSIIPGTTDTGNHCDDCTTLVTFPFPVPVYETPFTSAYVSSNGDMQFNTDNGGWSSGCQPLPINGLDRAFIPYQDDLRTDETGGGVFTAVIGSPPNRQFVIEWRTTYFQRSGTANFEVVLAEGSGTLSTIYGTTGDSGLNETSGNPGLRPRPLHAVLLRATECSSAAYG